MKDLSLIFYVSLLSHGFSTGRKTKEENIDKLLQSALQYVIKESKENLSATVVKTLIFLAEVLIKV